MGTGSDVTIREPAGIVAEAVGYAGAMEWDNTKPDGTPQKLLDVSRLTDAGWTAGISLADGVRNTVEWYRAHHASARG